jgi:hypothetical protein
MNTQNEIVRLKKQAGALKVAVLFVVFIGIGVGMFLLGGKEGYEYAFHKIRRAVASASYPTVYLTYPGKMAAAIVQNGVCTPYPASIPKFYHVIYVSPRWVPCATQHYVHPAAPSPALQAIENGSKG